MTDQHATVLIHGEEWKWSDIEDSVCACRGSSWNREIWKPSPALIDRKGTSTTRYVGQQYDTTRTRLVPDGWTHDHCEICWWTLHESEDEAEGVGYTDGHNWICIECHGRFVAADSQVRPAD